jgi:hypothetical protein
MLQVIGAGVLVYCLTRLILIGTKGLKNEYPKLYAFWALICCVIACLFIAICLYGVLKPPQAIDPLQDFRRGFQP